MLRIVDAVRESVYQDMVALQALQQNYLNLSSYADKIQALVESKVGKSINKGSIVAALSRIASEVKQTPSITPRVLLDDLSVKYPLAVITFRRSPQTILACKNMSKHVAVDENSFFTVTEGVNEITIIAAEKYSLPIVSFFEVKPKSILTNLASLTVRFSDKYGNVPNVIHSIHASLAVKRINTVEIVSTQTELSFIVVKKDLDLAVQALQGFLR